MDVERTIKMRYLKVLEGLKDQYIIKAFLAGLVWIVATLQDMFATQAELMLLLLIVICLDFITGNVNAKRQNIPIISFGWRQTIVKTVEYFIFLGVLIAIGNTFGELEVEGWISELFKFTANIEIFGFFFIIFTEFKSITENLTGNSGTLKKLFNKIVDKFNNNGVDV